MRPRPGLSDCALAPERYRGLARGYDAATLIILVLLYMTFQRMGEALLVMPAAYYLMRRRTG